MTRKKKGTAALPPPSAQRNAWQLKRDNALAAVGYSKTDVWRIMQAIYGDNAPSRSGVSAALDNRYRDERVHKAFLAIIAPNDAERHLKRLLAEYFPEDEPLYCTKPQSTNAA